MTYTIKNTMNGKTVRDACSGQPLTFSNETDASSYAANLLQANRTQAAFSLKSTKFQYKVVAA